MFLTGTGMTVYLCVYERKRDRGNDRQIEWWGERDEEMERWMETEKDTGDKRDTHTGKMKRV